MRGYSVRLILAAFGVAMLSQGCATHSIESLRISRYRPDAADRTPWRWGQVAATSDVAVASASAANPSGADAMAVSSADAGDVAKYSRKLRRGGRVSIHLRGIPSPEEVLEVVDDLGGVSLPLIGFVKLAGLSTSEAEKLITDKYIKSGYYTSITIIVVPEDEEYFVRGEVKQEGRYPIAGDLTLLQAIATAGGYTDYAKISKIRVIREGQDPMVFDASKIEKRREPDPLVKPGDIIVVPRRWLW